MSETSTIASVTRKLVAKLRGVAGENSKASFHVPPYDPSLGNATNQIARFNVFLIHVGRNSVGFSGDFPQRDIKGKLTTRPTCVVDLRYLVSCYGDDQTLQPVRLLDAILTGLHEDPMLPEPHATLAAEMVPATSDQLTELWNRLFGQEYRLSILVDINGVPLKSAKKPVPALPVGKIGLWVGTERPPVINRIEHADQPGHPLEPNAPMALVGYNLPPPSEAIVRVGDVEVTKTTDWPSSPERLVVQLAPAKGGTVPVGPARVTVAGTAGPGRWPLESQPVSALILPVLEKEPVVANLSLDRGATLNGTITIHFQPAIAQGTSIALLLHPATQSGATGSRRFDANASADGCTTMTFTVNAVQPGGYLVGIEVAGVCSRLWVSHPDGSASPESPPDDRIWSVLDLRSSSQ